MVQANHILSLGGVVVGSRRRVGNRFRNQDDRRLGAGSGSGGCLPGRHSRDAHGLDALPALWSELARPRKGSADEKIIPWLLERPVFEANSAAHLADFAESSGMGRHGSAR